MKLKFIHSAISALLVFTSLWFSTAIPISGIVFVGSHYLSTKLKQVGPALGLSALMLLNLLCFASKAITREHFLGFTTSLLFLLLYFLLKHLKQ